MYIGRVLGAIGGTTLAIASLYGNVRASMKAAGSVIILFAIALSIFAMPFSAHGCLTSKRSELGCGCCVKKVCCAQSDNKQLPIAQPLATTGAGHEISINVGTATASVGYESPGIHPISKLTSSGHGHSAPIRVLLCTFLI